MLDPFSLLPLALAAHDGYVDEHEVQRLVAAGLTLLQRSAALVRALSGKRAATLLPTSPSFFTALAACEGRGAVLINPLAAPPEITHQLRDANVGAVFTNTTLAAGIPADIPYVLLDEAPRAARVVADGRTRDVDLGSHAGLRITGDTDVVGSDGEAAIVYTSAMAGIPLGAVLTHHNLLSNARATVEAAGGLADDVLLAVLPFAHLFGLSVTAAAPLLAGGRVITMARFNPSRAAELLESGEITAIAAVPAVFRALLAMLERNTESTVGRLRLCICGGAPLDRMFQGRWFDATGVELRQGYGLTEAGPVCLFNRIDIPNVRGSLGVPFPGVEVSLRTPIPYNDAGHALPVDAIVEANEGEICVRGDNVFRGYVSHGELGLPQRDGWLHTGDLGRRDAAGQIVFTGVVKPMFTRNGFNIYPREIERVVAACPGVTDAKVREVAVPDRESEISLEVVGAISADDVKRWCADQLSVYKQPAAIAIRDD
ncbi:MAG TPA: AMP-binding protein [Gemmatimonadaceae bacterium]